MIAAASPAAATARPLHICHVLTRLMRAGTEENTFLTGAHQAGLGHRVTVLHGAEADPKVVAEAARFATVVKVPQLVHPVRPIDDLRAFLALRTWFRSNAPDVVHTHQSKAGIVGRFAAAAAGVPLIVHGVHILPFHNAGLVSGLVYRTAEHLAAAATHAFVHVSPGTRSEYEEAGIGRGLPHRVAYSAMDVSRFAAAAPPPDWRELLGLAPGEATPPVALMLSSFEPRKRHIAFVRALATALPRDSDIRFVFAGEGPTEPEVRSLVEELGLGRNVRLAGFRADPENMIALCDVCFLTSQREGLPRALIQATAAGKPVAATWLPGIETVARHGENAIITDAGDVQGLAHRLVALLADSAERRRMAEAAGAIPLDDWAPGAMNAAILAAYAETGRLNPA